MSDQPPQDISTVKKPSSDDVDEHEIVLPGVHSLPTSVPPNGQANTEQSNGRRFQNLGELFATFAEMRLTSEGSTIGEALAHTTAQMERDIGMNPPPEAAQHRPTHVASDSASSFGGLVGMLGSAVPPASFSAIEATSSEADEDYPEPSQLMMYANISLGDDASEEARSKQTKAKELLEKIIANDAPTIVAYKTARMRAYERQVEREIITLKQNRLGGIIGNLVGMLMGTKKPDQPPPPPSASVD